MFINGNLRLGQPFKATNLPAGGPAPPIAVPAFAQAAVSDNITAFAAGFNAMRRGWRRRRS